MPLHPAFQAFVDATAGAAPQPEDPAERVAALRATVEGFGALGAGEPPALASVADHTVDGPHGPIPVRIYTPTAPSGVGIVYLHGGGWVSGSVNAWDGLCRRLAATANAVVASVDYHLAPEHPFPGPLDDCHAALAWFVDRAGDFGVDPARVAIAGDSAGGNLSAAVALVARDRGPDLVAQVLVYPVTDAACDTPSMAANGEGYLLTAAAMRDMWAMYLGGWARDVAPGDADPLAAVLRHPDLAGLPPALVMTAEFDPLRDEGEAYAARLAEAGVPTTVRRFDGMIHGFFGMYEIVGESGEAIALAADFVNDRAR